MNYIIFLLFIMLAHTPLNASFKKNMSKKIHMPMIAPQHIKMIAEIFNTKPDEFPEEGVIKINLPRADIPVSLNKFDLDPFMGVTSWISFQKSSKNKFTLMAMGDLVLFENEVDAVISAALENNIKISALHNHFFYEQPRIFFMHIEGEGNAKKLATSLKQVLDARENIKKTHIFSPINNSISGSEIEKILGIKGQSKDGMFKVVIGRHTYAGCGCFLGKNMGINTWAAFAGNDNNAMVNGDFAVLENELQAVLKALRDHNISIVAIHNHMIHEKPRMLFVHYLGYGSIQDLSHALKHALNKTSSLH